MLLAVRFSILVGLVLVLTTAHGLDLEAWYAPPEPGSDTPVVVGLGGSGGAAVAIELAAAQPPAALILLSPFTSLAIVAQVHYPLGPARFLLGDGYASHRRIGSVGAPVR